MALRILPIRVDRNPHTQYHTTGREGNHTTSSEREGDGRLWALDHENCARINHYTINLWELDGVVVVLCL